MPIRVIDIETTGLDPATDAIIEVASIELERDWRYRNPLTSFVRPGRPIPPASSAIHHIIDADVAEAPTLLEVLIDYQGVDTFVAHNADFERSFLEPHGLTGTWICTMKCALRLWAEHADFPGPSNQALRYWFEIIEPFGHARSTIDPHRAFSDVLVTGELFFRIAAEVTFADMVQWSSEPALYRNLSFGKHRGMAMADAPPDYLAWLADGKHDLDAAWRHSAKYEIERRRANR
jgi:exodeoxyribonuclease X